MRLISGGDRVKDFEEIYKTYFNDVYFYIIGLSKNPGIAEEITSETFFRAIKALDSFKGNCEIRVWLCQIAKNCYFSYLRENKRQIDEFPEIEGSSSDFRDKLEDRESAMKIHTALHNLSEPYKEVFMLRVFSELSFRRIGEIFGKSENWACVVYYRAKKKLQEQTEDYI